MRGNSITNFSVGSVSSRTIYNTKANTKFLNQWQTLPVLDLCIIFYIYSYLINHWKGILCSMSLWVYFKVPFLWESFLTLAAIIRVLPSESPPVYMETLFPCKSSVTMAAHKVSPQYETWDCVYQDFFPVKAFSQWLYTYGFSPVWVLICIPTFQKQCSVSSRTT